MAWQNSIQNTGSATMGDYLWQWQIISGGESQVAWVRGPQWRLRTLTGPEPANAKLQAALDVAHLSITKKATSRPPWFTGQFGAAYVVEFFVARRCAPALSVQYLNPLTYCHPDDVANRDAIEDYGGSNIA